MTKYAHAPRFACPITSFIPWGRGISLLHVCLYVCSCFHGTAEPLDGVAELPDTQTSQQTDVNGSYWPRTFLPSCSILSVSANSHRWNSERASASESELIGQVENDQRARARRVIDRTRATQGEWTDAPVRTPESTQGRQLNQHNIWSALNRQVASSMTWGAEKAFAESCFTV